ncbi:MAG: hypothetical protein JW860_09035, partial [Sedimentisphaerales bacterium]|nr:hypothetical protein [Sedimentisphaerales bacterium]
LIRAVQFNNSSEDPDTTARTVRFTLNDGDDTSGNHDVTVTVNADNDAPTAADNTVNTDEDTAYTFEAGEFNFNDIDGDTLTRIQITTLETVGSLKLNGMDVTLNQEILVADINAGNLTYTPQPDESGSPYDNFQFKVHDGTEYSVDSYTMTLLVGSINDAPTATDQTVTTDEDTDYTFTADNFNFSDTDSDALTKIQITTLETAGALKLDGIDVVAGEEISVSDINAGLLTFTPVSNENGSAYDSFQFKVHDGTIYSTDPNTMTVDVTPVNDPPTSADNTVNITEDTEYIFDQDDFPFNDIDGDIMANVKITGIPTQGSLLLNDTPVAIDDMIAVADIIAGQLKFVPAADANGNNYDNFAFVVHDGTTTSLAENTITINVTAEQDTPISSDKIINMEEDVTYTFSAGDFIFIDADIDDVLVKIQIIDLITAGTLKLNGANVTLNQEINTPDISNLTFTPDENDSGSDYTAFAFKVHDGTAYSDTSYDIIINVAEINDIPIVYGIDDVTVMENAPATSVSLFSAFEDIEDADNQLSYSIASNSNSGLFTAMPIDTNYGTLTLHYTPNVSGTAFITIGAEDSDGGYTQTTFMVTVNHQSVSPPPDNPGIDPPSDNDPPGIEEPPTDETPADDPINDDEPDEPPVVIPPKDNDSPGNTNPTEPDSPIEDIDDEPLDDGTTENTTPDNEPGDNDVSDIDIEPKDELEPHEGPNKSSGKTASQKEKFNIIDNDQDSSLQMYLKARGMVGEGGNSPDAKSIQYARRALNNFTEGLFEQNNVKFNNLNSFGANSTTNRSDRFWDQFGQAANHVNDQVRIQSQIEAVTVGTVSSVSGALSVGYAVWALRGGSLLASVLSSMPAWRLLDPLPVLDNWDKANAVRQTMSEAGKSADDEAEKSITSLLDGSDDAKPDANPEDTNDMESEEQKENSETT